MDVSEFQTGLGCKMNRMALFLERKDTKLYLCDFILPELDKLKIPRNGEKWAVSELCKFVFGSSSILKYDVYGKPWPSNSDSNISLSHTGNLCVMIVSDVFLPGIDIEKERPQLENITGKLLHESEKEFVDKHPQRQWALQVIWGAKEAVYKSYGKKKLVFKEDMIVEPFGNGPEVTFKCSLQKEGSRWDYTLEAIKFEDNYLVFTTGCQLVR